ncbi:AraC-like DNA-binding protein [Paenibacillus qinlingensis]|uniref:AraC-like DNA-binding protein n=2 Tax=Paenibacillus qinlingensis TaxID=1837343 RepID=A0ABU1NWL7_9BACL|nr:AraC-like DNA-binding protein [Paenibacillus qinlingensis]
MTHIIIFLVPVIIGMFAYGKLEKVIYTNATHTNQALVNQYRERIDSRIKDVQQFATSITINPTIQNIILLSKRGTENEEYLAYSLFLELAKYRSSNPLIESYYIHLAATDSIVSNSFKTQTEPFYRIQLQQPPGEYDHWRKKLFDAHYYQTFLPAEHRSSGVNYVTFAQTMPVSSRNQGDATLVLDIAANKMLDDVEATDVRDGMRLYVLNKDNEVIINTNTEHPFNMTLLENMKDGSNTFRMRGEGGEEIITYEISQQTGWKYLAIKPTVQFMAPVTKIKNMALIALLLCMLIGIPISYIAAKRNYSPLSNLIGLIRNRRREGEVSGNEWDLVQFSLEESIAEESRLRSKLHMQFPVMRSSFISRLLKGQIDFESFDDSTLEFAGIRFHSNTFAVVLIDIEDVDVAHHAERQWAHHRFIVANIMNDALLEHGLLGYSVEMSRERIGVLVNGGPDATLATLKEKLKVMLADFMALLQQRFAIQLTVAVSDHCVGIERINKGYIEALRTIDFKLVRGSCTLLFFDELGETESSFYYPIEFEAQIIAGVKLANFESISELLEQVYRMNFQSNALSPERGKWLMYNMVSTLLKSLHSMNTDYKEVFPNEEDPELRLGPHGTIREMFEDIKSMYQGVCDHFKLEKSERGEQLQLQVTAYIHEHVYDVMLGLVSISDHFGLSPQYISKLFKMQTGETITECIAKIRIEEAKRLLIGTDLPVMDISLKLGYSTDIGLTRIFKKHEGVTPGKYRTMHT